MQPWDVEQLEIEDATGNRWAQPFTNLRGTAATWGFGMPFYLPTNELLKVRFTLAKLKDFAPEELWTITNLALPALNQRLKLTNAITKREGLTFSLPEIESTGAFRNGRVNGSFDLRMDIRMHFQVAPFDEAAKSWRIVNLDALRSGRYSQFPTCYAFDAQSIHPSEYFPPVNTGENARLRLALTKAITIEFLARPNVID